MRNSILVKKFVVTIEETIAQDFEVIAESAEQAMKIVEDKYRKCEFVLEPGELHYKQMAITEPNSEATEWHEF